ncbi:ribosomal protein S18-alanine N-acetyltransferase [Ignatzschineria cameli]|uniref:ribosomal protein S18-alanine N-acetyltransferase n=1 Tax=Ignatzschineria cameli TaxID=2182793 RepID=UPI000D607E7A|nr:ribosomal protein S18-alanine N-acetyltransferase [Ignatzschineria cameli]PWD87592.1 ribosomal-protein-alanine N-acetyltransferase [Ignatzschineria cameli]
MRRSWKASYYGEEMEKQKREEAIAALLTRLSIAPATVDDLETIVEIEQRAYPVPWSREQLLAVFQQKVIRLKLLLDGKILIGYAFVSIILDEGHLLHITVDPQYHGKRLGHYLLDAILKMGEKEQLATLFLEVRAGNQPARRLYDRIGFNQIGLRKGYYPCNINGREDAIVMAYTFPSATFNFKVDSK